MFTYMVKISVMHARACRLSDYKQNIQTQLLWLPFTDVSTSTRRCNIQTLWIIGERQSQIFFTVVYRMCDRVWMLLFKTRAWITHSVSHRSWVWMLCCSNACAHADCKQNIQTQLLWLPFTDVSTSTRHCNIQTLWIIGVRQSHLFFECGLPYVWPGLNVTFQKASMNNTQCQSS